MYSTLLSLLNAHGFLISVRAEVIQYLGAFIFSSLLENCLLFKQCAPCATDLRKLRHAIVNIQQKVNGRLARFVLVNGACVFYSLCLWCTAPAQTRACRTYRCSYPVASAVACTWSGREGC